LDADEPHNPRVAGTRTLRATWIPAGAGAALVSALLFGMTTPLAKGLLGGASPLLIAGLLYAGSGVGLSLMRLLAPGRGSSFLPSRSDWPWLGAAIVAGGIVAPALLMAGLALTDAAVASLLLNLEVVFTALIAWFVFREPTSPRVVVGLLAILAGGLVLVWPQGKVSGIRGATWAAWAIVAACLLWGLDNNLTRKVSQNDARLIAGLKGLVSGTTNVSLALALGAHLPSAAHVAGSLLLGFLGYGVSLVLFVVALRNLGAARTGAYFATAPFIGAAMALVLYGQTGGAAFWLAAACMAFGVWLQLTERHEHEHLHERLTHTHSHVHDAHHQHEHGPEWDGTEPHTHEHTHEPLRHSHPHFPDIHHQHHH
jgi:drug/metabolite transporter (DMT)-like permease